MKSFLKLEDGGFPVIDQETGELLGIYKGEIHDGQIEQEFCVCRPGYYEDVDNVGAYDTMTSIVRHVVRIDTIRFIEGGKVRMLMATRRVFEELTK